MQAESSVMQFLNKPQSSGMIHGFGIDNHAESHGGFLFPASQARLGACSKRFGTGLEANAAKGLRAFVKIPLKPLG